MAYRVGYHAIAGTRVSSWRLTSLAHRWASRTATHGSRVLTVYFHGRQIDLPASDHSMALALLAGTYEAHFAALLMRALKPGASFLDIGANVGLYTTLASHMVGTAGSVVSVEPVPETRRWLQENIARNGCDNVTVVPAAAGEGAGSLRIGRRAGELGTASAHDRGESYDDVPVLRLDDALPNRQFDVVKIDIEGYELAALRGMPRILASPDTILFLEYTPNAWAPALRELLAQTFPHVWLIDERAQTLRPIMPNDLAQQRRANIVACRSRAGAARLL